MTASVLHLTGSFHQGGSERQAVQLVRLLNEDPTYTVFFATLKKEGILLDDVEKLGLPEIPEYRISSFYGPTFAKQLAKCVQFLRKNKVSIIHTHDFYTNVFGSIAASLAGNVITVASKRETGHMRSRSQLFVEKQAFKMAHKIVSNSNAVKSFLIRSGVSKDKISVIYNGLDISRFGIDETHRKRICEEFGLPAADEVKFITMVANLRHAVKNHPMFLKTARRVLQTVPNTHFILAGEGHLREEVEVMANEMGMEKNVHIIGRNMQVPELLSISYACILTSFSEGFSNAILEYMAAGKPVVATNVGGANEAIIDGESGYLVESDDCDSMADRLIELIEDESKAARFGRRGQETVVQRFSLHRQLNKTLALYRD